MSLRIPTFIVLAAVLASCGGDAGESDEAHSPTAAARMASATPGALSPTVAATATDAPEPLSTPTATAPANTAAPAATATRPPAQPTTPPPPPATPTAAPHPVSVTVVAANLRFSPASLTAPAGAAITITLDNRDEGVAHNIVVRDMSGAKVAETEIFTGPGTRSVTFTPAPGNYPFVCSVHPFQMKGTLKAE
jgi:plastocyanin